MKPKLVALQSNLQSDDQNSVTDMVAAWEALEELLSAYVSAQIPEESFQRDVKHAHDREAELDRLTDKQQSLLSKVVQTPSLSDDDIHAKLELWKSCVMGNGENDWLQLSDKLVLSIASDFERLTQIEAVPAKAQV